ncbi:ChaN family lipoprotein [Mucilaginibacter sp. BT774]|uniref:ChaN family lipoprotein n=1 Tax=Mucilaginibacter sp. BT774 TaxID=3062276 RepID=UPI002674546E|nr:ChaN family lipoprotein [Mucilaginibacter sp. BT774]MDO3628928.1 ChaN family lipoprotein [Mucilaginibacter sp. BT774]
MKISIILSLLLLPLFAFCQEDFSRHYKIYDTRNQKIISVDDIISDMSNAGVLFFGEEHNDSTCHVLELTFLTKLAASYPGKTALSMEMFETDCQNVLNEYLEGLIREKNFISEARAWHNYKDYRSLIELAKTQQIPVLAANAPARYVNMVNRMGLTSLEKLSKTGQAWLPPLPIDTATGAYYEKFLQIMGGHSSNMGGMQMYQAQNLWDATMGWSIAQFLKKHKDYKILQLNGGFHSEEKLGAAAQLKKYSSKVRIMNIAIFSDENFDNPDWVKFSKNNDYIILTDPKLPRTY